MSSVAIDQDRPHPDRKRALDVLVQRVAHHRGLPGLHVEQLEHGKEDRLVRLRLTVREGGQHRVGIETVVRDELVEVSRRVREQPDLKPVGAHRRERRHRILVQLEVMRMRPPALHLDRGPVVSPVPPIPMMIRSVKRIQISSSWSSSG